jgi:Holliday junction resolvasome RuvABC endonuclease subunit
MRDQILAIDIGAKTGLACASVRDGKLDYVWCKLYEVPKHDAYVSLYQRLKNIIQFGDVSKVVYANVFHPPGAGNNAAHLWGGYHACAVLACHAATISEPVGYSEVSAKKYFTGNHQATKADVIAACETHGLARYLPLVGKRNPKPSEDAADALMLLCFAGEVRL